MGKQGQVSQSYIGLLGLLEASAHGCIVHAEMRRDLGQPVAMLPIGLVDDLALRASSLKQYD